MWERCVVSWGWLDTIEGFSKLAKPMTALLEKNAKFVWSEECQANFEELKKRLTTAPVLVLLELFYLL